MPEQDVEELAERLERLAEDPFSLRSDPVDLLETCLRHSSDDLKLQAARLAGSLAAGPLIKPLFELIASGAPLEIRRAGVQSLGQYLHRGRMSDLHREPPEAGPSIRESDSLSSEQFEAVRDFLGRLVNDESWPEALRAGALPHYASLAPEEAASHAERFYSSGSEVLREGAIRAISRVDVGHWDNIVMQELGRSDTDRRRREAVRAAAAHRIHDAVPELLRLLREASEEDLRRETARAVARLWEGASRDELQRFAQDDDPQVQRSIQEALYRLEQAS